MALGLEAKIAFHQLFLGFKSHRKTSFIPFTAWLTLLGVTLGVTSLIVVMSVMNGFEKELQRNTVNQEAHLILYRKDQGIAQWQKLKNDIQKVDPTIQGVLPITYNEVLFIHEGRVQGGILEGVDSNAPQMIETLSDKKMDAGAYIGKELAQKLQVKPGDVIKILLSDSSSSAAALNKIVPLKIAGIFDSGLYEYSSRYIYAPLDFTQKNIGWKNTVSAFKVKMQNPDQAREMARKIRSKISFPFFIRTWMDMNRNIFTALEIEKVVMMIILGGIICVALFNVVSSLIMIVIEKTKEISILKALGMSERRIARVFLWQGAWVGSLGTVLGVGLAWGICGVLNHFRFISLSPDVYYLSYLPAEIRLHEVIWVCVGMAVISGLAGIYPARRAAKLFPVEGIRYE